ncbi:MAG: DNA topoisomerase VI subunit B [Candidatus Aenigmarchaeota archaeon]|nr:DNA topoisomerase VI subunit B [Candidatus Aenigmarchaeota archaeon]
MAGKTAKEMAKEHREVSISEFFEKNRHLLGYDNKTKAMLIIVKEGVDNALDACEEAKILPDIYVKIEEIVPKEKYKIVIRDNGPGILEKHIPKVFGVLLFGGKFHRLRQSLTADEPILMTNNGKTELVKIGDFVDKFIKGEEGDLNVLGKDIHVPAFDKNGKYAMKKVSHLIKHKRENEILEFTLNTNRKIKVTGCHSLFTLNPETMKAKEIEARNIKKGDFIISPRKLPEIDKLKEINILNYLSVVDITRNRFYVHGIDKYFLKKLFDDAEIVHKKVDKSRKFFRLRTKNGYKDIVAEKVKYYIEKGFLPLSLVLKLGLKNELRDCWIQSYFHGKRTKFPITLELDKTFMRFLGLFISEGHTNKRKVEFTFGKHEDYLINEIINYARILGLNTTITHRERSIRVSVYGNIIDTLMKKWCGRGAKNKHMPEFVFRTTYENRKEFLKYLYLGDGHENKRFKVLHSTSKRLINEVSYLWLMQGVVATMSKRTCKGLGKKPTTCYMAYVFPNKRKGRYDMIPSEMIKEFEPKKDCLFSPERMFEVLGLGYREEIREKYQQIMSLNLNESYSFYDMQELVSGRITKTHTKYLCKLGYLKESNGMFFVTKKAKALLKTFEKIKYFYNSDICLLRVKDKKIINSGYNSVYDISVPDCENFVGGYGGISCHNSRGAQGLGISCAVLYSQLTTGESTEVLSSTGNGKTHRYRLKIDIKKNRPVILEKDILKGKEWHGVQISFIAEGLYKEHKQSVLEYLKETAISNPFSNIVFESPIGKIEFKRGIEELPMEPKQIRPHLHGVEVGILTRMIRDTKTRTISSFLTSEFTRVGKTSATEICKRAELDTKTSPRRLKDEDIRKLYEGVKEVKLLNPPTDVLSPLKDELIENGLKKELNPEFVASISRPPTVYRGWPFQIECVTGDTKIILENGRIIPIKKYVENEMTNTKVYSMDKNLKIAPKKVLAVQKILKNHKIYKIRTRSGREIQITGNNEIPVIENGNIEWKRVDETNKNNFIAVPRKINIDGVEPFIIDLLEENSVRIHNQDLIISIGKKLKERFGTQKNSAKHLDINYNKYKGLFKRSVRRPTLAEFKKMVKYSYSDWNKIKKKVTRITIVDNKFRNPIPINIPLKCNEDLLYLLGLINSDGHMAKKNWGIFFTNNDGKLHDSFKNKIKSTFGLDVRRVKNNSIFYNKTTFLLLKKIREALPSLTDKLIISWLKGYADGDGMINARNTKLKSLGFATAKIEKAEFVQFLLLRLGIISKIEKQKPSKSFGFIDGRKIQTKKVKYNIIIQDAENMRKFNDYISFRQNERSLKLLNCINDDFNNISYLSKSDIVPLGNMLNSARMENGLTQFDFPFSDQTIRSIEKKRQNITRYNLNIIAPKFIKGKSSDKLKKLANSEILCDKICSIEEIRNKDKYVYDLTVESGNFVANNIIIHNCGIAYGGSIKDANVMRFANRVPLLYKAGDCAITKAIVATKWKRYGIEMEGKNITEPIIIFVHMCSVWVPYTSESKEAIANYPVILKELKLALQDAARKLSRYLSGVRKAERAAERKRIFEKYAEETAIGLEELTGKSKDKVKNKLLEIVNKRIGEIELIEKQAEAADISKGVENGKEDKEN